MHSCSSSSPFLSANRVLQRDGPELPLLPAAPAGGALVVVLGVAEDGVAPEVHAVLRRLRLELHEEIAR